MKHIAFLFALVMLLGACKKDSDAPGNVGGGLQPVYLEGEWRLVLVEGGFSPNTPYTDEVIWLIEQDQINVQIADGTTLNANVPFQSAGVYPFQESPDDALILSGSAFNMSLSSTNLVLENNLAADGIRMTFERAAE
jgi:hypothetical protein